MQRHPPQAPSLGPQTPADRVVATLERFLHVEAVSGIVLLIATAAALLWANSPAAHSYHALWHTSIAVAVGGFTFERPLEFWINDGLMTIFFLVVGLEIRRETHEGTLATPRAAALPLVAALGGVAAPALIYIAWSSDPALRAGWAVPTATDIAFAVGVLALLGRSIPASIRVLLLALAVIDDIVAILVIALFYSSGFQAHGLLIAAAGVLIVILLQRFGVRAAFPYLLPGAIVWAGLLLCGVHPTLSGVILGLLTPTTALQRGEVVVSAAARALTDFDQRSRQINPDSQELALPLRQLRDAERELLPPVTRVQLALHPWVAYAIMPLFALANAGIGFQDIELSDGAALTVCTGVFLALLFGKPLGIVTASWLAVRAGLCSLPSGVSWRGIGLVGILGGIGFTMAIFIANLAFAQGALLGAAKLGILLASAAAGVFGLLFGYLFVRQRAGDAVGAAARSTSSSATAENEPRAAAVEPADD